jgi:hypothetical protein
LNCFSCEKGSYIDMVEIGKELFKCALCDVVIDVGHAEDTRIELLKHGFVQLSNEDLADRWMLYFKKDFPHIKIIKHGIGQHIFIDDRGHKHVKMRFLMSRDRLFNDLSEVQFILNTL